MSARLCSDSDHSPLCYTFYRLILGKQNSVELSLYSAAYRGNARRWRPTGRYKKHKFTRVGIFTPKSSEDVSVAVFVLNIGGKVFLVTVSLLPGLVSINHIHTLMRF